MPGIATIGYRPTVRRRREGALSAEHAKQLQHAILADLEAGFFQGIDLTRDIHRRAERFLLTLPVALRAADALHLALAVEAGIATDSR